MNLHEWNFLKKNFITIENINIYFYDFFQSKCFSTLKRVKHVYKAYERGKLLTMINIENDKISNDTDFTKEYYHKRLF